jgi:ParB-like chromosome segregation protein Spo0J
MAVKLKTPTTKVPANVAATAYFETREVADLYPSAKNSRKHPASQIETLKGLIAEYGFTNPVLVSEEGEIIAGHGRVLAAQALGLDKVPCFVLPHLTEVQRRAYLIADNKAPEGAVWDLEMLAQERVELEAEGVDFLLLGFSAEELDNLTLPDPLGEEGELLNPKADDEVAETTQVPYLRFGSHKVPLTPAEALKLEKRLKAYVDEIGNSFGFVNSLIKAA